METINKKMRKLGNSEGCRDGEPQFKTKTLQGPSRGWIASRASRSCCTQYSMGSCSCPHGDGEVTAKRREEAVRHSEIFTGNLEDNVLPVATTIHSAPATDIPCGDKILEYLVVPALKKLLRPVFYFQSISDDFQEQNNKLSAILEKVENDVHRDRDNARVIYENVERWLKEVNASMPEVRRVERELEKNKSCCFRYSWCPNWTCHYKFSKQVSEIAATMKTLCANGELFNGAVSYPPRLHQDIIGSSSSACFMHSQSSKSALDQIMEALNNDEVNLIGLFGGVGTGKTTLAELVAQEAKAIFHHVILVPASQKPDVRRMQGLIADFLNLSLEQLESDQARATTLQLRLKNGDKILIILDNVWKDFNLGAVGIPTVGCKLLLTTRAKVQVPDSIRTQRDVELGTLLEDEAWTLFESVACVGNEVRMHGVAKDALAECCGLPKAVLAMGLALNGKGVSEWRGTLQQLKEAKFKILNSLKEDAKNLILRRERVSTKITMAKQNVREIYPDVEKWLNDVERVLTDVEHFENELNQSIWCFDEGDVTTKVEALATSAKDLYGEGNFEQVSYPTQLVQDMGLLPSEEFVFSKAAKLAWAQIMEAMKTDGVSIIGLYGMGGIGKTTLVNQVQKEVVRQNIFNHAVMVTVSQKPDVGKMQNTIAEALGFDELKHIESLEGRASKLKLRLKDEKILIVVDDVWKKFDLTSIGIMLSDCKACKILLTTRRRDVCSLMNSQQEIQLKLFSEDESQTFFKKKAGLSDKVKLNDVAKQIVEECKCLPIALETVAAGLKNKGEDEWTEALDKLRNAQLVDIMGVDDDEKNAYKCVKVSYDYLKGSTQTQQTQFMLLLCSLFPEDYKIMVEDLTRYAFGMELFERVSSIEDARRKVRVTIRSLKDSCLLLDNGDEEHIQIHDVVRDTMLWIGGTEPQERKVLTVRDNEDLKHMIKKKSFQNCRALSIMPDVIPKLSKYNMLECPNLETVLIFATGEDVELGEGFFEHMKLKVLDIKGGRRRTKCKFALPQSLRTLMLRSCECSNSSTLKELRKLRILSLNGCEIDGGVEVVLGLKKLRLLDVSGSKTKIRMLSSNVIETLTKLEELHGYTVAKGKDEDGRSRSLSQLESLPNLVALSVEIEDAMGLPTGFCFPNLTNYYIRVGAMSGLWWKRERQTRRLELMDIVEDESVLVDTYKKLFTNLQDLFLSRCEGLCSLDAFNSHAEGFLQRLESLEAMACNRMEWIFEFQVDKNNTIVQLLKILRLHKLTQLKHIWKGPTRLVSLGNLTQLDIYRCEKLSCIFSTPSLATSMHQLEILNISVCPNLEEIISIKEGSDDDDISCCCYFKNLRELRVSRCDKVKTIFPIVKPTGRAPHLHPQSHCCLPKLQTIDLHHNKELEHIFGLETQAEERVGVECPSLQVLVVTDCPNISTTHFVATQLQEAPSLKPLKADSVDNIQGLEQRRHDDLSQYTIICSSSLKIVELRRCYKLKRVFMTSLVTSLCQMECLIVEECDELEQIISKDEDGKEEPTTIVCFENMKTLKVSECGKLNTIFPITIALPKLESLVLKSNAEMECVFGQSDRDYTWQCPFLEEICVVGCPKMYTQFAAVCIQNMSIAKAKNITLDDIKGVEEIMQIETQKDNDDIDESVTCQLLALDLRNVVDLKCIWRGRTENICFVSLVRLEVIGCNRLKHLLETTIATTLPQLEFLTVKRCNELEQVIVMAENGKEKNGVAFRKLTTLEVSECEKLKTILTVSIALPILETLRLESNAELEHVFGQSDWGSTSQCPSLEDLCVVGCPKICTHWIQNQTTTEKMKTIELGYIQGLEELIQLKSQGNDLLTFPCETLYLRNVEELKCIWRGPTNTICFPNLYEIKVIGCNRLKHVFTTAVAISLPNLEKLIVRRCNELEQVIMVEEGENDANAELTKEVGFQNLSVLHVSNCEKLKTIFSMFISLPVLDCLRLESNAELESVFGQSDSDCTSQWTYLNVLSVTGCSNLGTHSIAFLTSQLQPHSTAKKMRIINLSNIQGVEELVHFQEKEEEDDDIVDDDEQEDGQILKLEEVGELKRIWSGPTENISFSFVGAIRVIGCNRLKQVFTTTMASTLHNLALLFVESCHDLEQVIVEDGNEDSNVQLQLELPSLKLLRLIYLPKLVSFCPSSCNFVFPPLTEETMQVEGCPKPVTDFFSKISYQNDDKVNDDDGDGDEDNDDGDDDNDDGDEDGDDGDKDEDGDDDGNYTEKSISELLGIY